MRLVALLLAALLPSLAFAASPVELWREALAKPGTHALPSHGEDGYRVDVIVGKATELKSGATIVPVSFAWSEINTELEEPAFTKPSKVPQRKGLPAQIVIADDGIWVLSTPGKSGAVPKLLKTAPTFTALNPSGVVERPLRKGPVTCFTVPGPSTKKASQPVELCLAPGAGLVAAKGIVPKFGEILFVEREWAPAIE